MAEPPRLLDDPGTSPLARSLLASAEEDGPSPDRRRAAARRLGIAAITLAGGSKAGSAIAAALWWKTGLVLLVLGTVVGVAVMAEIPDLAGSAATDRAQLTAKPASRVVAAPPAPEPAELPTAPATEPTAPATEPTEPVAAAPTTVKPRVRKVTPRVVAKPEPAPIATAPVEPTPPAAPTPPPVQVDARRLAAEVAVLDRARGALKHRDAAAALAALDQHRRDFADGALVAEAEVVRIETLILSGQHAAARDQAQSFLARFPSSPLVRRVRSLVEQLKESP